MGALWLVASTACFSSMWMMIRYGGRELHVFEVSFFRFLFGLAFMAPLMWRRGGRAWRTRRLRDHGLNGVFQVVASNCTFLGVTLIQLAEVTALTFTAPLFATAGAALFLGEQVGLRRWTATAVGFLGALIILRPGLQAVSLPAVIVLVGSAFIAAGILASRSLARTERPETIVLYLTLLMAVFSAPAAAVVWTAPTAAALAWLAGAGLAGTLGLTCMACAYRVAEASAVMPFRYASILFAALYGYVLFGEVPDLWTWVGAAIIVAAALYTARREAQLARKARAARAGVSAEAVDATTMARVDRGRAGS